ncbi:unnamed protein product, partial [Candidula unifasciata]
FTYKDMEEELTCPVCLELYADPLMLPCTHSICKACLQEIMTSRNKGGKKGLECPTCRQNHVLTSDEVVRFPKNLALENIVFRYQEIRSYSLSKVAQFDVPESSSGSSSCEAVSQLHKKNSGISEVSLEKCFCGMCEETERQPAEWFCQQCQVFYCQLCLGTFHPKRGTLSQHKIQKATVEEPVEHLLHCPDHSCEAASIFCDTCKVVACHLCVCQGVGSHCHHMILDLDTARKQLREALQAAKNQLSTLMTTFFDKNNAITSQIQDVKDVEDTAKNIIISQYNCILSDVAATLNLVKQKTLEAVSAIARQHSAQFTLQSHQIKSVLQQCRDLNSACNTLLTSGEGGDVFTNESPQHQHLQGFSDLSCTTGSPSLPSQCSVQSILDSGIAPETKSSEIPMLGPGAKRSDSAAYLAKSHLNKLRANIIQNEVSLAAHDQKVVSKKMQNMSLLKNRSASDTSEHTRSYFLGGKLSEIDNVIVNIKTRRQASEDMTAAVKSQVAKFEGFKEGVNDVFSEKTLAMKLSEETLFKTKDVSHSTHLKAVKRSNSSIKVERGSNSPVMDTIVSPVKESIRLKEQLLLKASEVGSLLRQVASLMKEHECQESVGNEDTVLSIMEADKHIFSRVSEFSNSCLGLLSSITDMFPSNYPVVIPVVQSGVTPPSLSVAAVSRIPSRTLISWGFNSTTFTAEPLEGCTQWSVNVNRNTNHIGDINTGYLFGLGVSTKPLTSKEQVGMTAESHGIACIGGQLVVCQASATTIMMPLPDLPICATIAVAVSKCGLVMAYKVMITGISSVVSGRRVITLDEHMSACHTENENKPTWKVYPVFTVSQRIKLQLPTSSSV